MPITDHIADRIHILSLPLHLFPTLLFPTLPISTPSSDILGPTGTIFIDVMLTRPSYIDDSYGYVYTLHLSSFLYILRSDDSFTISRYILVTLVFGDFGTHFRLYIYISGFYFGYILHCYISLTDILFIYIAFTLMQPSPPICYSTPFFGDLIEVIHIVFTFICYCYIDTCPHICCLFIYIYFVGDLFHFTHDTFQYYESLLHFHI